MAAAGGGGQRLATRLALIGGVCMWPVLAPAQTQAQAKTEGPAPAEATAPSGVTAYPASFFASSQPSTALDMISRLPGFSFDAGADVRGYADAAGNVLIDGQRPASKSDSLSSILTRIPANQVERIDLIRGGASGIDMQGRTVVANVIRRKGAGGQSGALTLALPYSPSNGFVTPQLQLDQAWKWGARTLSLSVVEARSVNPLVRGQHSHLDGPDWGGDCLAPCAAPFSNRSNTWSGSARAVLTSPLAGGKLELHGAGSWSQALNQQAEAGLTPELVDQLRASRRLTQGEMSAHYEWSPLKDTTVSLIGLYQTHGAQERQAYQSDSLQSLEQHQRYSESIGRATIQHKHSERLSVKLEGEFAYNVQTSGARLDQDGVVSPLPAGMTKVDETRFDGGGTLSWTLGPNLSLDTGLRYESSTLTAREDVNQSKTVTYWKPKLLLTWTPDEPDQVQLRLERSVSQTDFKYFVASGYLNTGLHSGNPTLVPQASWDAELTVERSFGDGGDVTLVATHSDIDQDVDYGRAKGPISDFNPDGYYGLPANIGRATDDSLSAKITLPLRRLGLKDCQLKFDGAWDWGRVKDPATGQTRPMSDVYADDVRVNFIRDEPKIGASEGVVFVLPKKIRQYRFNEIDESRLPAGVSIYYTRQVDKQWQYKILFNNLAFNRVVQINQVFTASRPSSLAALDVRRQSLGHIFEVILRRSW